MEIDLADKVNKRKSTCNWLNKTHNIGRSSLNENNYIFPRRSMEIYETPNTKARK